MFINKILILMLVCTRALSGDKILDNWMKEGMFPGFGLYSEDIDQIKLSYAYEKLTKTGNVIGCIYYANTKYFLESNNFGPAGVSTIIALNGENSINCEEKEIDTVTLNRISAEITSLKKFAPEDSILSEFGHSLIGTSSVVCRGKSRVLERGQNQMVRGWTGCLIKGRISGFVISFVESDG